MINTEAARRIDELFTKRAIAFSILMHLLFLALKFEYEPLRVEERRDAIQLTIASPELVQKNKYLLQKSPIKEVVKAPVEPPKQKVVVGTERIVPNATELGNPKAKEVKKVQKGDPMSKNFTKYKPGTEFQKTRSTSIGEGSTGSKLKTVDPGGGSGDTYKGADFSVKSLTDNAPLGKRFKIRNAADDMGAGSGSTGGIGAGKGKGFGDGVVTGTSSGTLEKAKILNNVGSLTGATVGTIDSSKGAKGLGTKGSTIMFSGSPEETVIMGSIDPDEVRRRLMEHLAQFRYCYQSELEKNEDSPISGVVTLGFTILSNGSVGSANVSASSAVTSQVKACMAGVLRGIEFPKPKGGGKVEIRQPLNLQPKRM